MAYLSITQFNGVVKYIFFSFGQQGDGGVTDDGVTSKNFSSKCFSL